MQVLEKISKKGTDFLGSKYPIICGAMAWIAEHNLVSAVCEAGGFGTLACGSMPPAMLDEEIKKTKEKTDKPFAVNTLVMHPQIDEILEVCKNNKVSHMVLAGGLPKAQHLNFLKENGIKTLAFAPALAIAKRLIRAGIDGLIIEGTEAGGHIGAISTNVLIQEILFEIDEVPVFVAGGIVRGEMIASYLMMGAAGCQLGTRFVCTKESVAHENYKKLLIKSSPKDAITCTQVDPEFPIIPVRAIKNKGNAEFIKCQCRVIEEYQKGSISKQEAQLEIEHFWAGALRKAVVEGDIEMGSVMAGQIVGSVKDIKTVQEVINELTGDIEKFLNHLKENIC